VYCKAFGKSPVYVKEHQPVVLTWGWAASTEAQVYDHINAVIYDIFLDGKRITNFTQTEVTQGDDGWYQVRWKAELGALAPGTHRTEYLVSWKRQVSDGENTYGPGGSDEVGENYCEIIVQ